MSGHQQTINIQNLYQMYQANTHSANDKCAALDSIQMGGQGQQMAQPTGFGAALQPQQQNKSFMPNPMMNMPQQ